MQTNNFDNPSIISDQELAFILSKSRVKEMCLFQKEIYKEYDLDKLFNFSCPCIILCIPLWYIQQASPRARNDPYKIWIFLYCSEASEQVIFSLKLSVTCSHVNKYHIEVLKLVVYQFHWLKFLKQPQNCTSQYFFEFCVSLSAISTYLEI